MLRKPGQASFLLGFLDGFDRRVFSYGHHGQVRMVCSHTAQHLQKLHLSRRVEFDYEATRETPRYEHPQSTRAV